MYSNKVAIERGLKRAKNRSEKRNKKYFKKGLSKFKKAGNIFNCRLVSEKASRAAKEFFKKVLDKEQKDLIKYKS